MAPMILDADEDDDFVRTLSDDQFSPSHTDEESENLADNLSSKQSSSRKRKHEEVIGQITQGNKKQKSVKEKGLQGKAKKHTNGTENGSSDEEDHEEAGWTAGGENDGAIDPEFEFNVQDADRDVIEGFEAWGRDGSSTLPTDRKQGDKKGVDIDELIARRRQKHQSEIKSGDDAQDKDGSPESSAEEGGEGFEGISEGSSDNDSEATTVEMDEEDEMLAEDAFGMGATFNREEGGEEEDNEGDLPMPEVDSDSDSDSDSQAAGDEMPEPSDVESTTSVDDKADSPEKARRDAFFAPEEPAPKGKASQAASTNSFQTFSLSRPILRGLTSAGFTKPTPIQSRTIPVALLGKDVVGGAVTGSGKTAAFIIPILERLLYRPKKVPTSRVAILTPTRELAVQCFNVACKLANQTDVTFCRLVGGFSLREQENELRKRPDVIIATPGRFIDHMRNSPSFTVDTLEILVLDEADRMLEEGFADELNEILTTIPQSRQTMLFSATMTDSVDKLIRVGLNKPIRLLIDAKKQTVGTLTQEFVRLRPGKEDLRLAYLVYLCQEVFEDRVIIFFRQKKEAHRIRVIFGLLGIKAAELHGNMSQEQRLNAIHTFTAHTTTHLLATDLASRGLDIPFISTVLNFSAPQTHEIYLHRVGRTARAGRLGRSCTIAAEDDRKVIRSIVRTAKTQKARVVSRVIPTAEAETWAKKLEELEGEVEAVLREEKEERALAGQEMMVKKGENLLEHGEEIRRRERRTWFVDAKGKEGARRRGAEELNGVGAAAGGGKKGKGMGEGRLSEKEKKRRDDRRERVEGGRVWKKGKGDGDVRGAGKKGDGKKGKMKGKGKTDRSKVKKVGGKKRGGR